VEGEAARFDAKGSYYYGVSSRTSDVQVASIDLETGHLLESPAPVTSRFTGSNHDAAWSPDGRYLTYLSDRGSVPGSVGNVVIVIQSAESGEKREILPPLFQPSRLAWSPDGQSFLVQAAQAYGQGEGLYGIDVLTGEVEPLVLWTTDEPVFGSWGRNTHELVLFRLYLGSAGINDERSRISVLDLETGQESVLAERNVYWPAVSRERGQVAFTQRTEDSSGELVILPIGGGEPHTLLHFETSGPEWPLNLVWGPDGRHIYYMLRGQRGQSEDDPVRGLWRMPVTGGEPQKLGWATEAYLGEASLRFHPDGSRIALVRRQEGAEVWVMESFLPSARSGDPDGERGTP
jgi:Tol biopolymer transport system component